MFSLFKKQKVNINSFILPDFGWQKTENTPSVIKWVSPDQTAIVSVNFMKLKPDLPTINDATTLRNFYRSQLNPVNGNLIQVDIIDIHGMAAVKCIFKVNPADGPIAYLASLTIPFESYSFVLKVQAIESGIAGMREAVILNRLLTSREIIIKDDKPDGWFADPYNPDYNSGIVINKSEQELYDNEFPDHPLTIVRAMIGKIEKEMTFKPEMTELNKFNK